MGMMKNISKERLQSHLNYMSYFIGLEMLQLCFYLPGSPVLASMAAKSKFTVTPSGVNQQVRNFAIILKVLKDGETHSHTNDAGAEKEFMSVSTIGTDNVRQDITLFGEAFAKFRGLMTQGTQLGFLLVFV